MLSSGSSTGFVSVRGPPKRANLALTRDAVGTEGGWTGGVHGGLCGFAVVAGVWGCAPVEGVEGVAGGSGVAGAAGVWAEAGDVEGSDGVEALGGFDMPGTSGTLSWFMKAVY